MRLRRRIQGKQEEKEIKRRMEARGARGRRARQGRRLKFGKGIHNILAKGRSEKEGEEEEQTGVRGWKKKREKKVIEKEKLFV